MSPEQITRVDLILVGSHLLGNNDEFHEIPLNPNVSDLLVATTRELGRVEVTVHTQPRILSQPKR